MSTSESQDQPTAAHVPADRSPSDPSTVSGGESLGADTSTAGSLGNKLLGLAGLGEETTPTGRPAGGGGPVPSIPGYEVLGELGRGGMGVVYRGRQLDLNRTVALKVILAGGYASEAEVARFVGESEAVARVDHPNVVRVYHAGRHDGLPFFAMEYVDGGTLADRVKSGPLPARESAELVEQVARGMAAAHGTGIVHRDLKPGNVLVTRDGTPKVTDFGLAKRVNTGDGLTASGAVMGTPSYMAPEQARGEAVGPAADVYALGAVLYCLLTGRPPFQGPSTVDTLLQVMTADPVAVRQLQPGVPRDLETIALKCLDKDPDRRYPSAEALADDLARFLDGKPVRARPAGPVERGWKWIKRNRVPAGIAAGVIVALAAAAAVTSAQAVEAERARAAAVQEATNARVAEGNAREAERLAADRARTEQDARAEAVRRTIEAERQERAATAVKEFLQAVLVQASATVQASLTRTTNPNFTVKEAMDYASRQIDGRFPDQPLTEADLRETIGTVYGHLGSYREAEAHLRRAIDLRIRVQGERDPATLAAVDNLAGMYQFTRQYAKAEELYSRTLRERQRALGEDHPSTLGGKSALAGVYWAWGKYAEAEPLIRESSPRASGSSPRTRASSSP